MLKGYRRRFVISNMILVGAVLLAAFIILGVVAYRNDYNELKNTMSLILRPWDSPNDSFRSLNDEPMRDRPFDGRGPDDGRGGMPEEPDMRGQPNERIDDKNIITVIYNVGDDEISILSDEQTLDRETLKSAIHEIADKEKDFGILRGYKLIYFKEGIGESYRIALADTSYLGSRTLKNALMLFLIFAALMGLFLFISIRLSKVAAKPMENAIEMERQFVADISHDLKTPITVILANNSIIKSNPASTVSDNMQWLESTDQAAKNMTEMINEMLTLSSLESAEKNVVKSEVSLSEAAEKCVLQMESLAYERGVTIESETEGDVRILSTAEYAERICSGLIENALKYEPVGGTVAVKVFKAKKKAMLEVKNRGSVIDEKDLPHIFERFYRGDKARGMKSGHGLGLPILKKVTELSGGEITAASSAENGTVFTVSFEAAE